MAAVVADVLFIEFLTKQLTSIGNTKPFQLNEPVFVVRFMVDTNVVGCCWIELPKGNYRVREEKSTGETDSRYPGKVGRVHTHHGTLRPVLSAFI